MRINHCQLLPNNHNYSLQSKKKTGLISCLS